MKIKNLLIITVASIVMFGCGGSGDSSGWPKEDMDLCVSQGSTDFTGDIAECICGKLEKTYSSYGEVETMFSSNTPNMEELQKIIAIFVECGMAPEIPITQ